MIIFDKTRILIDYTITITDNTKRFPKKHRFTFVDKMQNLTLNIYKKLSKVNEYPTNKRKDIQIDVLGDINVLLALIDISLERKFITKNQAGIWTKKVLDVKYLTAAWLKKSK
jgi:hypothetical protein